MRKFLIAALLLATLPVVAWAQTAILQSGPNTVGHVPSYFYGSSNNPTVVDSGLTPGTPLKAIVSTLPSCTSSNVGQLYVVTDALSPTYGGALTGGSSTVALALCNGSAWLAH